MPAWFRTAGIRAQTDEPCGGSRDDADMLELFQTEWCRGSQRVRQRLTELGIDFVARQVPEDPADRDLLELRTGVRSVPVLMFEDGAVLAGTDRIIDYLENLPARPDAVAHAEKARRSLCKRCAELPSDEECGSTPTSHHRPRAARAG
jgi:glutathione S-transferase